MTDDRPMIDGFLCFAVYAAGHAFNRAYKPLLDALGLTYPQYLVLVALWERDGLTVGGIGEKLFLESNTLTPLLKRLEGAGYVRRERHPDDERQVRVMLTDRGQTARDAAKHIPGCILLATGRTPQAAESLRSELAGLRAALDRPRAA